MGACCSHSIARCAENAVAHDFAYAFAHSAVLDLERASR
jgi:hypothetical protein